MTVFLSKDHNEDVYSFNVGRAIHEMIDFKGVKIDLSKRIWSISANTICSYGDCSKTVEIT